MLSLTDVTCPHCGAKGQVVLPPVGTIIVGPCPECKAMVALFCGRVLPLSTDIILNGSIEEKQQHMMAVLTKYLEDRVKSLFSKSHEQTSDKEEESMDGMAEFSVEEEEDEAPPRHAVPAEAPVASAHVNESKSISSEEVERFVNIELSLLDDKDYFDAVFG